MARVSPLGVFINCPFDRKYQKFFDALVFAVIRCGFDARCAREIDDGGGTRIDKIMDLIEECRYGIHDICRTELDSKSKLPRFNMPLELGIFLGARRYGARAQARKQCLILDRERYRYQQFISDISGQDIHSHSLNIPEIITHVRDFLRTIGDHVPGGARISADFERFQKEKIKICERLDLDWKKLTFHDLKFVIAEWISQRA
jgi:hypothetical protein